MKVRVVILVLVGILAAAAVAVLFGALQAGSRFQRAATGDVEILVASRDLPLMAIVDTSAVEKRVVPAEQARECLRDSVQVVGKALCMPMVEGQAFKADCFASRPMAYNLAEALPNGMRAVSLLLEADEALENLLYPGSKVDVLAWLRIPARGQQAEDSVSLTLLPSVQVLAVNNQTIVSQNKEQVTPVPEGGSANRKLLVTLMVSPKDAEMLQLAQQHGRVSLSMRNPMDDSIEESTGTPLSEIARLYQRPAPVVAPVSRPAPAGPAEEPKWQTTVYRAGQSEVQSFPLPSGQ